MTALSTPAALDADAGAGAAGDGGSSRGGRVYRALEPSRTGKTVRAVLLFLAAVVTLFPFYAMVVLSLKPTGAIVMPEALLPWPISTEAYEHVLGAESVLRWTLNTAVYSIVSVVAVLFLASLAGYAFARKRFPGKEVMFWSFIAMIMVPYHVTLVPSFIVISEAGGVNTYWGLILPTLANAQAVFLMRQFIKSLPDELFEAAMLDGCSEWRMYVSMVLPLIKPILATLGVFVFLWHWNDFLWPLIVGQSSDMRTLTTGLASLNAENAPLNIVLAGSVVAFVPIFMAYLVGQRYFTEGVAMTGVKG